MHNTRACKRLWWCVASRDATHGLYSRRTKTTNWPMWRVSITEKKIADRLSFISSGPHFAIQGFGMYGRNFRSPSRPWRLARLTKCPVTIDARSFTISYVIGHNYSQRNASFVGALESNWYCNLNGEIGAGRQNVVPGSNPDRSTWIETATYYTERSETG